MKRIVLIGTLLLVFVLTTGTASARIILPPGWPFLPPIIAPPVIEAPPPAYDPNPYGYYTYPDTYGYYSYPYGYYGFRGWGPGYWGYGGWGRARIWGPGYWGHGGRGKARIPGHWRYRR